MTSPFAYSTPAFENKFTYTGSDLGANWSPEKTLFRLWAPTASAVSLNLYEAGNGGTGKSLPMTPDRQGTWVLEVSGNLHGTYYTFSATVDGVTREACDPYARTTGLNGHRAMVLDLRSTDPEGWERDSDPNAGKNVTDAVIYELHVRDLSIDPSSGITQKGKFLGLTETGTRNPHGQSTGLDHMKALGITHLHLLPSYDYGSVDESSDAPQFNWGYDPVNFNVPEGSYSTDPRHGQVRVREMKEMIRVLHENGISVVLDVVYNHVFDRDTFCFNRLVPGYFSRGDSNGSGCGNDTASERSMVRKYIVDSVKYWADEYHMDGFRFDLLGLIDVQTVREITAAVHADHPNVIFYGEGWDMPTDVTKAGLSMAIQKNSPMTPGFAYFSDTIRDLLRGSVWEDKELGFISGQKGLEGLLLKCFMGAPDWCKSPTQTINYASCHDNMTLIDRITVSTPNTSNADRIRMNNLAAAVYMLSQGIPFIHAGEEFLRTKGFDHNSYKSPDSVNAIKWNDLSVVAYQKTFAYYQGLIAFRKAHKLLRLTDAAQVKQVVRPISGTPAQTAAFHLKGEGEELFVIFNASRKPQRFALPQGKWQVCIDGEKAGTAVLSTATGSALVSPISAMVLVR